MSAGTRIQAHSARLAVLEVLPIVLRALGTTSLIRGPVFALATSAVFVVLALATSDGTARGPALPLLVLAPIVVALLRVLAHANALAHGPERRYSFTEEGVSVAVNGQNAAFPWASVRHAWETPSALAFFAIELHVIAKAGFACDEDVASVRHALFHVTASAAARPARHEGDEGAATSRERVVARTGAMPAPGVAEPEDGAVELRVSPTREDWVEALEIVSPYGVTPRQGGTFAAVALAVATLAALGDSSAVLVKLGVTVALVMGGLVLIGRLSLWAAVDEEESRAGAWYSFGEHQIVVRGSRGAGSTSWDAVQRVIESDRVFLVQIGQHLHVLPRSSFRSEAQLLRFRETVERHVGRRFTRV